MTIRGVEVRAADLIAEASGTLLRAGIEQPRLEARWLLARILDASESRLLAHPDLTVDAATASRYQDGVRRRTSREPFAYVVGDREFYGRTFVVDRRVLVPRPETEHLVEAALSVLASRAASASEPSLVVDVGTGSGAIACTIALEAPTAKVVASDISADALAVAATNRARLDLHDRLDLVQGSLLSWLRRPADLVVANLPYLPGACVPTLMPEVANWEPHLALDGGADGLDLIRAMLSDADRIVKPGGTILLEMDPAQIEATRALLPEATSQVIFDLAGLARVLRFDLS
jgi:release factor glutamine methyltransferase